MQKFTRELTREIEIAGQRLAVTLNEKGVSLRPVGSQRPPAALTWWQSSAPPRPSRPAAAARTRSGASSTAADGGAHGRAASKKIGLAVASP
jgi:hypothetical protein